MKKLLALFAIFLAGCANMAQPLSTPSGRPEVTITASNTSEVKSVISNAMMNRGFSVKNDSESLITYEKTIDDVLTATLFGTRFNTKPASRISFSFASSAGTVRVLGSIAVISNPGSGFEQATDFSQGSKDAENIQAMLEQVKRVIVSTNQGRLGIQLDNNYKIIRVSPNSPAEKAGLRVGDQVKSIDGVKAYPGTTLATEKALGPVGTSAKVEYQREGETRSISILRELVKN